MRAALVSVCGVVRSLLFRRVVAWRWLAIGAMLLAFLPAARLLLAQDDTPAAAQAALTSRFVYQGRLHNGAQTVNGPCDLRFRLFDVLSGGTQVGNQQALSNVVVSEGLFAVTLNAGNEFGAGAFTGERRWLEVAVRCPAGSGSFVDLTPRQELVAAPYALYAPVAGSVPWSGVTGIPGNVLNPPAYSAGAGLQLNGSQFSVVFAGSGVAESTARSDHDHLGQHWSGSADSGLIITNTSTLVSGGYGLQIHAATGTGLRVVATNSHYATKGIAAVMHNSIGPAIDAVNQSQSDYAVGLSASTASPTGTAIQGMGGPFTGANTGVRGFSRSNTGIGVFGEAGMALSSGLNFGVRGVSNSSGGRGVDGRSTAGSGGGVGVFGSATSPNGYAGLFSGRVQVLGDFFATTKNFLIDHPLDPENKLLIHSTVESSERLNIYSGNVTLDANGTAEVPVADWFTALNTDFRYQLTAIGASAPNLYIAAKLDNNAFRIGGGLPGMEVSWQISGVRHDPAALANPLVVEQEKPADQRGLYLSPAAYGQAEARGLHHFLAGEEEVGQEIEAGGEVVVGESP